MTENTIKKFESIKQKTLSLDNDFKSLIKHIEVMRADIKLKYKEISESTRFSQFTEEEFDNFLKKPYTILPTRKDEWFVVVPKFIKMNIGWLDHADTSYNIFKVNKFVNWLGEIPRELESKFKFKEKLPLTVFDGMLLTGKEHQEEAWSRYYKFLTRREGKDKIKVKRGREFDLIASLLNDGILPFIPKSVNKADLNEEFNPATLEDWQQDIWNRDYVQSALKKFMEYGAVGIYWAFSCGKSVFGSIMCKYIKGKKLVVVPTRMLVEQWEERLKDLGISYEVDVITYNSYHKTKNKEYKLMIFDECHRLPANTYSRLSTISAKYRIGLCLDKNTLIETKQGKKKIIAIEIGDEVKSFDMLNMNVEFKKVTNKWLTKKEKIIIRVSTPDGIRKLICSPDHKIFTGGRFIKAKDLSSSETIMYKGVTKCQ